METVRRDMKWVAVALALSGAIGCDGGSEPAPRTPTKVYAGFPPHPAVQLSVHRSPRIYPVADGRVKEVRLDAVAALVDLGTDGKYVGWSWGGQIPGPTVRVRVGDRVRFILSNRTGEAVSGFSFAPVDRSFAVAGVLLDREDEGRTIAPGQTLELEGTAMNAGVHLYRAGHPAGAQPLAAGLYGMLIADPAEGFAAADREYALVQGELYAGADPSGRRLGEAAVKVLDEKALTGKRPSHFGYSGRFAPGSGLTLPALPGERVRFFLLNAGPHATANFKLPELPFASVWPADVLAPGSGGKPGAGPVLLPPGRSAIVEVVIPKKGRFRFADQQLGERGLVGLLDAAPGDGAAAPPVLAAPRTPAERRERGRMLYTDRCVACHDPPAGGMRMAPALAGLFQRRDRQWLVSWLTDPPKMQAEDPVAKQLLREWNNVPMPQMMLSPDQIDWILEFLGGPPPANKRG